VAVGQGTFKYANGDIYNGNFERGLRHGEGTYTKNNGSIYEGQWI